MTHGSLFSGFGGFDLAAEWMGWGNKFHCEWNDFGQNVLKYYWPDAESFTDITKTDFTKYANRIDILTGGFPCQPYSLAGKRKGKEDERHLWPEMLRAIREIQPRWVVGENVFGLINWSDGLVFHEVQTDLEAAGYEVWSYVLPAVSVNAPHRRDRVWFVAYRSGSSRKGELQQRQKQREFRGCDNEKITPNPHSDGQYGSNSMHEINASEGREHALNDFEQTALYSDSIRLQGRMYKNGGKREIPKHNASAPNTRTSRNTWKDFPTQSPICTGDDGIPRNLDGITFPKWRNESIKAAGNAIVPQVALQIFKAIEQYEQQNS